MLTPKADTPSAREMCRIGAENESSGFQAQHAPPNYPDLPAAGLPPAVPGELAAGPGLKAKTLILS